MLTSNAFCTAVKDFWPLWRHQKPAFTDPRFWWDADKLQVKELAISHSVLLTRERTLDKGRSQSEFRHFLSRSNTITGDHVRLAGIENLLKAIDDQIVEGFIIRSKEQWMTYEIFILKEFILLAGWKTNASHVIHVFCVRSLHTTLLR